jgi:hypothetical protein
MKEKKTFTTLELELYVFQDVITTSGGFDSPTDVWDFDATEEGGLL